LSFRTSSEHLLISYRTYFSTHYSCFRLIFMILRAASRAQRASARQQQGSSTAPPLDPSAAANSSTNTTMPPIVVDVDAGPIALDDDLLLSRSNSSVNLQPLDPQPPPLPSKTKKTDKGKGKEVDTPPLRVKEEPKSFTLNPADSSSNLVRMLSLTDLALTQKFSSIYSSTTRIIALLVAPQGH